MEDTALFIHLGRSRHINGRVTNPAPFKDRTHSLTTTGVVNALVYLAAYAVKTETVVVLR